MRGSLWPKELLNYFQGLLKEEDRLYLIAPWGREFVMKVLWWHKVESIARELYLSSPLHLCSEFHSIFHQERINQLLKEEIVFRQLEEIENAFRSNGIEFLVLKGPFWAQQVYSSTLWRHMGDVDLLIRPEARDVALTILFHLGYQPDVVGCSLEEDLARRGEVMFIHPGDSRKLWTSVELHWQPLPAPRFIRKLKVEPEDFFAWAKRAPFGNLSLVLPRPEVRFGYQVVHSICQHQLKRFLPLLDLAHLLERCQYFDFDFLMDLMRKWKATIPLYLALKFLWLFGLREGTHMELLDRLERVMPWRVRLFINAVKPMRMLQSYSGKSYYVRRFMRILASHPFDARI